LDVLLYAQNQSCHLPQMGFGVSRSSFEQE
jgi:hypothetical protein